jgi:hypothetical protein
VDIEGFGGDDCNSIPLDHPDTCVILTYSGDLPSGIVAVGAAGIAGQAKSAFVDSQVRDIEISGSAVPEDE